VDSECGLHLDDSVSVRWCVGRLSDYAESVVSSHLVVKKFWLYRCENFTQKDEIIDTV
jgi:hypothetical protein